MVNMVVINEYDGYRRLSAVKVFRISRFYELAKDDNRLRKIPLCVKSVDADM